MFINIDWTHWTQGECHRWQKNSTSTWLFPLKSILTVTVRSKKTFYCNTTAIELFMFGILCNKHTAESKYRRLRVNNLLRVWYFTRANNWITKIQRFSSYDDFPINNYYFASHKLWWSVTFFCLPSQLLMIIFFEVKFDQQIILIQFRHINTIRMLLSMLFPWFCSIELINSKVFSW